MKKMIFFAVIALLTAGIFGCTKEGPRGQQGPAGADGIDGQNGTNGTNGINGKDGNANVQTILITNPAKLTWSANYIQLQYDSAFSIPDSIRNEGVVLIYMSFLSSTGFWYAVPGWGPNGTSVLRSAIGDTRVALNIMKPDGTSYTGTPPTVHSVRVVLISPSAVGLIGKKGHVINFDDYEEVRAYFNLD